LLEIKVYYNKIMSKDLQEVKYHFEQLCWLIERTDTVDKLILLKEVCAGFQFKEEYPKTIYDDEGVEVWHFCRAGCEGWVEWDISCDCEEEICPVCGGEWTSATRCECINEEDEKIVCVDCHRDFTNECDGRSSFDEIGKIQCENCFLKEK
jgi:hypothetical protein